MRRHLIHFLLVTVLMVTSAATAMAQNAVKGQVVDAETGEPLIGAAVAVTGTTQGAITDINGDFTVSAANNATLKITYLGYKEQTVRVPRSRNLGVIQMQADAVLLSDVTITSSIAIARKTPVAVSTIDPVYIEERLGTQEFPEILKSTPGVYATKDGGGYGDSRINLRGFGSPNIAVMVNGVPVNDMEWGGVYWSNWTGLTDVTRFMQVQRGLGASKIASPSVGGSINIITNSTDAKKGGSVYYGMGNDGYNKVAFSISSGLNDKGWAFSLLGSKTWGDGYIQGTEFDAYAWFINISKMIGDNHSLSLTATGSPQSHNRRAEKLTIVEWEKQKNVNEGVGYKYNPSYGIDSQGRVRTGTNYNYYHKPQISLNHIWDINAKSNLSSSLYMSIGNGYGYRGVGAYASIRGAYNGLPQTGYRKPDGTFDYDKLMQENAESDNGGNVAIAKNENSHMWYGLLSTYSNQLNDNWNIQGGLDLRYYVGGHKAVISDLLGGAFIIDPDRKNGKFKDDPTWVNKPLYVGDVVYRNFDSYIGQYGAFGQAEYTYDKLSAFASANVNLNTYSRKDYFYYDDVKQNASDKIGYGVKGGANYNITDNHNVFANVGYFSRTPFYSGGIYLNSQTSNELNTQSTNEKVFSFELGYGYTTRNFNAVINLYRTSWLDKAISKSSSDNQSGENAYLVMTGVDALHQGVELEFTYKPVKEFELRGMFSMGDWEWKENATGYWYDRNGQALDRNFNVTQTGSADHASTELNLDGVKVGNSAQTTAALSATYEVLKGLRVGVEGNYFGRNYSDYDVAGAIGGITGDSYTVAQPWRIPHAYTFDARMSYRFKFGNLNATWTANVNNLLNEKYITDARDNGAYTGGHDWQDATVFYGFGRTWSTSIKIRF